MRNDEADGSLIEGNGWRQGAILPPSLVQTLIAEHQIPAATVSRAESHGGWFGRIIVALKLALSRAKGAKTIRANAVRGMVVSQDCDLVQPDWDKEPYVELIRIQPAGDRLPPPWGQNPREIQFSDPHGGKKAPRFVCSIHDRVLVDRKYLTDTQPDESRAFDAENVKRIRHWISRRYVRASFPGSFNDRVKSSLDALAKRKTELDMQRGLFTGIYVRVSEAELEPDGDYEVLVWAAMRPHIHDDPATNAKAQELLDLIEAELGSCSGIEVMECELKSEQEITLDHLHDWKRRDFDVLSLRPITKNAPLPPVDDLPPDL
ncbi:MAG: hypothetical protein O3A00_07805 [Planctomycetota bacterium]|nr:hypothetical protein [Planctomycetota bacterium]